MPTLELLVTESHNDAQEQTTGIMNLTISESRIGQGQRTGARYLVPDIPQGATINSALAYIQMVPTYTTIDVLTTMENVNNASIFTTTLNNIRDRSLGLALVGYINPSVVTDEYVMIGDLVESVQDVVNRVGWSPGYHMVMVIRGSNVGCRTHSWDADPLAAPKLIITYNDVLTVQPIRKTQIGLIAGMRIGAH